ncbi:MAG: response regulator [Myxococcaceae bacterium]|nr:response regulator [Myxococcaceae bacterium]
MVESEPMKNARILLIDDDPDIAAALTDLLTDQGHAVQSARNGKEALVLLLAEPLPQLIFLDLTMPVMDGAQFRLAQLRDRRLSTVPVVLVSADRNLAARALELKVDGWLPKPTTAEQVLDAAERFASS